MVRAKFKCTSKSSDGGGHAILLEAVTSGSEENDNFFHYTPYGSVTMGIVKGDAAGQFEVGKEYYVDFTPA